MHIIDGSNILSGLMLRYKYYRVKGIANFNKLDMNNVSSIIFGNEKNDYGKVIFSPVSDTVMGR